jgi:hypothetical protein
MEPCTAPNKRHAGREHVEATSDAMAALTQSDPAKAKVMDLLRKLVAAGLAEWQTQPDGTCRLRLVTGETYLLEPTTIMRIA